MPLDARCGASGPGWALDALLARLAVLTLGPGWAFRALLAGLAVGTRRAGLPGWATFAGLSVCAGVALWACEWPGRHAPDDKHVALPFDRRCFTRRAWWALFARFAG